MKHGEVVWAVHDSSHVNGKSDRNNCFVLFFFLKKEDLLLR